MKLYNTLTKKKETFVPIEEGKVRMYVCGPTVYDYIHIGNARPMIVFDTVRRYMEYKGYDVNFVSNFTDVDDKIIKRAIEENVSAAEISERYIRETKKDMEGLNVKPATVHPKATEEINGMIEMIQNLIEKGHAYEKNGTVYFRTKSFSSYGKLSKKNIEELEAGHRELKVDGEEEKENPFDFVLWKPKKEGEPYWDSPWGAGRPGWHIECSVMSRKYLGEQIDIHAGGEDLVFPHHENEIAQSEAANGKEFARYWMHNGFLYIDNNKMSKSKGNFFTIRQINEVYPLQVLRFFILSVHYRSPINFSRELMESSKNALERITTAVFNLNYLFTCTKEKEQNKEEQELFVQIEQLKQKFEEAMEDDFNTAAAISVIFEIVKLVNSNITVQNSKELIEQAKNTIQQLCEILGIETAKKEELLEEVVEQLIEERQLARKEKNFVRADEIREELLQKGIILEDTREGVRWKRV